MNNVGRVFGWVKMLSNVEQMWKLVAFERTLNDILRYGSAVIWSVSIKLSFSAPSCLETGLLLDLWLQIVQPYLLSLPTFLRYISVWKTNFADL